MVAAERGRVGPGLRPGHRRATHPAGKRPSAWARCSVEALFGVRRSSMPTATWAGTWPVGHRHVHGRLRVGAGDMVVPRACRATIWSSAASSTTISGTPSRSRRASLVRSTPSAVKRRGHAAEPLRPHAPTKRTSRPSGARCGRPGSRPAAGAQASRRPSMPRARAASASEDVHVVLEPAHAELVGRHRPHKSAARVTRRTGGG